MINILDPKSQDRSVESLVANGGIDVWKKWAKPLLDSKKSRPGTIRLYLTSLIKFSKFIVDQVENKVKGMPEIDSETLAAINRVIPRFVAMGSSVGEVYAYEKWEKRLEDEENAIDPNIAKNMMETDPAKQAIKLLQKSITIPPMEKQFLSIRDFLIARLVLENCQRPGAIETAKLQDLKRAKEVEGKFVMRVSKHKTSKAGPAPITMSANVRTNIQTYIGHVRPHFVKENQECIFITREGTAFPSGTIGKRVSKWWKKAAGIDITSTALRKMGSSSMSDANPVDKRCVHKLMCHRTATAEEFYMINNLTQEAARGHEVLNKKLGIADTVATCSNSKEADCGNEDSVPMCDVDSEPTEAIQQNLALEADRGQEGEEKQMSPVHKLSTSQLDDIDLLFSDIINTNAALSFTQVKNIMSESVNLVEHIHNTAIVKKVYNRVRYLQGRDDMTEKLKTITEENATERSSLWVKANSVTSNVSKRFSWAKTDEEIIKIAFREYESCPNKATINSVFAKTPGMKDILDRNGYSRCYEKVKTVYKQKLKK